MSAIPKTNSNELVESINRLIELLNRGEKNDVLRQRIKKEIDDLMRIDSIAGHRLSGIVCGIEGDKVGVKCHFEKVLSAEPNNSARLHDYAAALYNSGLVFDALNYARLAYQAQKSPDILRLLIEILNFTARFEELFNYLAELKKMNAEPSKDNEIANLEILKFMKRHDLHDDDISQIRGLAEKVVLENDVSITAINSGVHSEGDEEWLSLKIYVNSGSAKETVRLNDQFVDCLIDSFPHGSNAMDLITCRFATA